SVRPERAGRRLDAGEPVAEVRGVARLRQRPRPGLLALVEDDLPDAEDAGVERGGLRAAALLHARGRVGEGVKPRVQTDDLLLRAPHGAAHGPFQRASRLREASRELVKPRADLGVAPRLRLLRRVQPAEERRAQRGHALLEPRQLVGVLLRAQLRLVAKEAGLRAEAVQDRLVPRLRPLVEAARDVVEPRPQRPRGAPDVRRERLVPLARRALRLLALGTRLRDRLRQRAHARVKARRGAQKRVARARNLAAKLPAPRAEALLEGKEPAALLLAGLAQRGANLLPVGLGIPPRARLLLVDVPEGARERAKSLGHARVEPLGRPEKRVARGGDVAAKLLADLAKGPPVGFDLPARLLLPLVEGPNGS